MSKCLTCSGNVELRIVQGNRDAHPRTFTRIMAVDLDTEAPHYLRCSEMRVPVEVR